MTCLQEDSFDVLTIDGSAYSGETGPLSVPVNIKSQLLWSSDESVFNLGWSICWALSSPPPTTTAPTILSSTQHAALMDIYESTAGPGWKNNQGWGVGDYCDWHGIACSDSKSVTKL